MLTIIKKANLIEKLTWSSNWIENYDILVRNLYIKEKLKLEKDIGFNLKEPKIWNTYQGSISMRIDILTNIRITIECYDVDLLTDYPVNIRWKAIFIGEINVLVHFEKLIEEHWKNYLEMKYREDELARKQKRMAELERILLI